MIRRRRFKFQVGFAALLVMCFFSWRRDDAISEIAEKSVKVVEEVSGTCRISPQMKKDMRVLLLLGKVVYWDI